MGGKRKHRTDRSKKRAKKDRKRKEQQRAVARRQHDSASFKNRVLHASSWDLLECAINEDWQETKFARVFLSREGPGSIAAVSFSVDLYCLGIRDCGGALNLGRSDYREFREEVIGQDLVPCRPELALKVVRAGADYAASLGFPPRREDRQFLELFGSVDPAMAEEEVVCGRGGRPVFFAGPSDDIPRILSQLEEKLGPDGFEFVDVSSAERELAEEGLTEEGFSGPSWGGVPKRNLEEEIRPEDAPLELSEDGLRDWLEFRTAEKESFERVWVYGSEEWPEFPEAAFEEFCGCCEDDGLLDRLESRRNLDLALFGSWLLFGWVPDPEAEPAKPLALEFLKDRWEERTDPILRFVETVASVPLSFYTVTEVRSGCSLGLRDLFTGEELVVVERDASRDLKRGAILFTRVVRWGSIAMMTGCGTSALPPLYTRELIEIRNGLKEELGDVTPEILWVAETTLREIYLTLSDSVRHRPQSVLQNTDGEPLVPTILEYELNGPIEEMVRRLTPLSLVSSESELLGDADRGEDGRIRSVEIPWLKAGNEKHTAWENTVLGTLRIVENVLEVEVNSKVRAARIKGLLEQLLGTQSQLVSEVARPVSVGSSSGDHDRDEDLELREAENQDFFDSTEFQKFVGEHWESWLNTEIPMLRDESPRQASQSSDGRELLEALFDTYASGPAGAQPIPFPEEELREKLGLPQLVRDRAE